MARLKWNIVHECDDDNGNPTQWAAEINHPDYGRFVWIDDEGGEFVAGSDYDIAETE